MKMYPSFENAVDITDASVSEFYSSSSRNRIRMLDDRS